MKNLIAAAVLGLSMTSAASAATIVLQDTFDYGATDMLNIGANFLAPNWTAGPTLDYIITNDFGNLCRGTGG